MLSRLFVSRTIARFFKVVNAFMARTRMILLISGLIMASCTYYPVQTMRDASIGLVNKDSVERIKSIVVLYKRTEKGQWNLNNSKLQRFDSMIRRVSSEQHLMNFQNEYFIVEDEILMFDSLIVDFRNYKYTGYRLPRITKRMHASRYLLYRYWRLFETDRELIRKTGSWPSNYDYSDYVWTFLELNVILVDTRINQVVYYKNFEWDRPMLTTPRYSVIKRIFDKSERNLVRVLSR